MTHVTLRGASDPIRAGKVVCVAANYRAHAAEMGGTAPPEPVFFLKPSTSIIGQAAHIRIPAGIGEVHHEVELAVLVGTRLASAEPRDALSCVAGYGVGIDVTARDLQAAAKKAGRPWSSAKGYDTFCPLSEFVPATGIPDPQKLELRLKVNDDLRQHGSTGSMVHPVSRLLAAASRIFTLEPGDVLLTGTPEGVGPIAPGDTLLAELVGHLSAEFHVEPRE